MVVWWCRCSSSEQCHTYSLELYFPSGLDHGSCLSPEGVSLPSPYTIYLKHFGLWRENCGHCCCCCCGGGCLQSCAGCHTDELFWCSAIRTQDWMVSWPRESSLPRMCVNKPQDSPLAFSRLLYGKKNYESSDRPGLVLERTRFEVWSFWRDLRVRFSSDMGIEVNVRKVRSSVLVNNCKNFCLFY